MRRVEPMTKGQGTVQEFIARENIKRFEARLATCTDAEQRLTLTRLLEEAHRQLVESEATKASSVGR
jgi:hypothetical protein